MTHKNILLLPGDGIGPEVVAQGKRVLGWAGSHAGVSFTFDEALLGGAAYDAVGTPFPAETLEKAKAADAILLGAVGGPQWEALDYSVRPERGLLGIRKELDLFANLRPAMCFPALADASSLKPEIIAGLDIVIVRELTGDIYFGHPRGVTVENGHRVGRNTMIYADWEVTQMVAKAMGADWGYTNPSQIMDEIAMTTPSFARVTYDLLDEMGSVPWPCNDKAPEGTPLMHIDGFVRGKGKFIRTEYVATDEKTGPRFPLLLTTGRILSQYNVGAQTRRTANVVWHDQDVLEIHPHDAENRGIHEGDWVRLASPSGVFVNQHRHGRSLTDRSSDLGGGISH